MRTPATRSLVIEPDLLASITVTPLRASVLEIDSVPIPLLPGAKVPPSCTLVGLRIRPVPLSVALVPTESRALLVPMEPLTTSVPALTVVGPE